MTQLYHFNLLWRMPKDQRRHSWTSLATESRVIRITCSFKSCLMIHLSIEVEQEAHFRMQCFLFHQKATIIPTLVCQSQISLDNFSFTHSQTFISFSVSQRWHWLKKHIIPSLIFGISTMKSRGLMTWISTSCCIISHHTIPKGQWQSHFLEKEA